MKVIWETIVGRELDIYVFINTGFYSYIILEDINFKP